MLITILTEQTIEETINLLPTIPPEVDCLELRLDFLSEVSISQIKQFMQQVTRPVIFTLRPPSQGGYYTGTEQQRLTTLKQMAVLNPTYIDIEHTVDSLFIDELKQLAPNSQLIRSYHNYLETPNDLESILEQMQHPHCHIYKMAVTANSAIDSLRVIHFLKNNQQGPHRVTAHCMGEAGIFSRFISAIFCDSFFYSHIKVDSSSFPGCQHTESLLSVYNVKKTNKETQVYALLGSPVSHSVGHIYHNQFFQHHHINAIYMKIPLKGSEVDTFFEMIADLPFKGFSVTSPLKQVMDHHIDAKKTHHSINTLKRKKEGGWVATNTDCQAIYQLLSQQVSLQSCRVLIFGAGGVATAIATRLAALKARITIMNRNYEKALKLALHCNGEGLSLEGSEPQGVFDVILNTIPGQTQTLSKKAAFLSGATNSKTVILDVNYAYPYHELQLVAKKKGAYYLDGMDMFKQQANLQLCYWFGEKFLTFMSV